MKRMWLDKFPHELTTNHTLTKERLEAVNTVMHLPHSASDSQWEDLINKNDPCIWCGILLHSATPDHIKIKAIEKATLIKDSDVRFFLPILFAKNELRLHLMSEDVSEKFVEKINYSNFMLNLKKLYAKKPAITELPFSNTYIEDAMIKKLLYSKTLSSDEKNEYNSYKILEHYQDEDKLKKYLVTYLFIMNL